MSFKLSSEVVYLKRDARVVKIVSFSTHSESMDFEVLMNSMLWFEKVMEKLCLPDLLRCEQVSRSFYESINQESVWRVAATNLFDGKMFVPPICRRFLLPGNSRDSRKDLEQCTVRELKLQCAHYRLDHSECFEKLDIIEIINKHQLMNSYSNECLAKYAVRIAWIDRKRTSITFDELIELEWCVRIRSDGPLAWLCDQDPWWAESTHGAGKAKFYADGKLSFQYPPEYNPFGDFEHAALFFELEYFGTVVKLNVGAQERLCRHPENWGWVMMSIGTLWTGYEMPPRNVDALLDDVLVENLLQATPNYGFSFAPRNNDEL